MVMTGTGRPERIRARIPATRRSTSLRLHPAHRRGRLFGLSAGQLVAAELGAVAGAVAALGPSWLIAPAGVVAVLALVGAFTRLRGWWWWELVARRRRMRAHAHDRHRRPRSDDARLTAVRALAPALEIQSFAERGAPLGIGRDGAGWFAVAVVEGPPPTADQLAEVLDAGDSQLTAVQVVVHTVPVPAAGGTGGAEGREEESRAAASYRELVRLVAEVGTGTGTGGGGEVSVPALDRVVWLAVRLDVADANIAAASRGGGERGVHRALAAAVGRLVKTSAGTGTRVRALDADELLAALARSVGPLPARNGSEPTEDWTGWWCADRRHTVFGVRRWPELRAGSGPLESLATLPAAATSVALVFRPDRFGTRVEGALRVVTDLESARQVHRSVRTVAGMLGLSVRPLDGEQAPAVYATAPTGGGPR